MIFWHYLNVGVMKLDNLPFCAGIGREEDRLNVEKIELLKQETEIDRSETSYAGKGRIGSKHITLVPERLEHLHNQNYL